MHQDSVWCDVAPLEICHLLFCRPWQYDHKSQHDGEANTYTFINNSPSFRNIDTSQDAKKTTMIINKNQFKTEKKEVLYFCLVVGKPLRFLKRFIHFSGSFADITPMELPNGLSPIRDIQHCINFVPVASLALHWSCTCCKPPLPSTLSNESV